jgi:hypothetical protein
MKAWQIALAPFAPSLACQVVGPALPAMLKRGFEFLPIWCAEIPVLHSASVTWLKQATGGPAEMPEN